MPSIQRAHHALVCSLQPIARWLQVATTGKEPVMGHDIISRVVQLENRNVDLEREITSLRLKVRLGVHNGGAKCNAMLRRAACCFRSYTQ